MSAGSHQDSETSPKTETKEGDVEVSFEVQTPVSSPDGQDDDQDIEVNVEVEEVFTTPNNEPEVCCQSGTKQMPLSPEANSARQSKADIPSTQFTDPERFLKKYTSRSRSARWNERKSSTLPPILSFSPLQCQGQRARSCPRQCEGPRSGTTNFKSSWLSEKPSTTRAGHFFQGQLFSTPHAMAAPKRDKALRFSTTRDRHTGCWSSTSSGCTPACKPGLSSLTSLTSCWSDRYLSSNTDVSSQGHIRRNLCNSQRCTSLSLKSPPSASSCASSSHTQCPFCNKIARLVGNGAMPNMSGSSISRQPVLSHILTKWRCDLNL